MALNYLVLSNHATLRCSPEMTMVAFPKSYYNTHVRIKLSHKTGFHITMLSLWSLHRAMVKPTPHDLSGRCCRLPCHQASVMGLMM